MLGMTGRGIRTRLLLVRLTSTPPPLLLNTLNSNLFRGATKKTRNHEMLFLKLKIAPLSALSSVTFFSFFAGRFGKNFAEFLWNRKTQAQEVGANFGASS